MIDEPPRHRQPKAARGAGDERNSTFEGKEIGHRESDIYQQAWPPSTTTIAPVIGLAAPEARKCTTDAISSGCLTPSMGVNSSQDTTWNANVNDVFRRYL
jgi:hypothetical protein